MHPRLLRAAFVALSIVAAAPAAAQSSPADQALLRSITDNDAAATEAAIRDGASPHMRTDNGSVLSMAVIFSRPAVVRVLLEHGADVLAEGPNGGNAVNAAFFAMNGVRLLGRGDEPDPAERADAVEVLRLVARGGKGLDVPVRIAMTNRTPLMQAAEAGALDAVRILLDAGADPNAVNIGGYTALDLAVDRAPIWTTLPRGDRIEIVRALLAKGARTRRAGADRVTPLERARRAGYSDIAALLAAAAR